MESKKITQVNVYAKQKKTHKFRKQTSGYPKEEGRGERHIRGMRLRDTNYYKIDKQQGYIV